MTRASQLDLKYKSFKDVLGSQKFCYNVGYNSTAAWMDKRSAPHLLRERLEWTSCLTEWKVYNTGRLLVIGHLTVGCRLQAIGLMGDSQGTR